jgi:hypothetical protein
MLILAKCGSCGLENMDIAIEVLRNGDVGLNIESRAYPLRKNT